MAPPTFSEWAFDVSSFMVLLSEDQEANYRLMRRSLLEVFAAAPVAGLQNYLRSNFTLYEAVGPTYMSPTSCKTAPLRNMRTARTMSHLKLLKHSGCTVYRIKPASPSSSAARTLSLARAHWQTQLWILFTWIAFACIISVLSYIPSATWIGMTTCCVFTGWSIINRLLERHFLENAKNRTSQPDQFDAVVFMGPRNSCLVLEGRREDVCEWTGLGVIPIETNWAKFLRAASWTGSLIALLLVFIAIPNGSSTDQLAFVSLCLLAQLNVKVGQRLNAMRCMASLEKEVDEDAKTRTHVYGFLLRRFGNSRWVEEWNMLPKTRIWEMWRERVMQESTRDAKALYDEILEEDNEKPALGHMDTGFSVIAPKN